MKIPTEHSKICTQRKIYGHKILILKKKKTHEQNTQWKQKQLNKPYGT